jgi:hypothetical protein
MTQPHLHSRKTSRTSAILVAFLVSFIATVSSPTAFAQDDQPGVSKGNVVDRLAQIEDDVDELKKDKNDRDEGNFADGILTLGGGSQLRFGGKVEMLLIDSDDDAVPTLGPTFATDEPDAHLVLQRLRLAPVFDLNRWISVKAQIDLRATDGDTVLKELIARHDSQPYWWLKSRFQIGLDDRFIRPARRTKGYPLIGNAFWRDESMALTWALSAGHPKGTAAAHASESKGKKNKTRGGAATEGFNDSFETDDVSGRGVSGRESGSAPGIFDFAENWGQFQLIFSLGQGYELGSNEVNFDSARFNDLVQDDRSLESDLALREFGVGFGWRRNFQAFGDISILGFFFDDELRASSIAFLQGTQMTARGPGNAVIAGYGNSNDDGSSRCGVTIEYFLPASSIFASSDIKTRKRDGLRMIVQWIRGEDGQLERDGWYVQGSYRVSFGKLVAKRYFRSFEPIVRYGMLDVDAPSGRAVGLPGTWNRQALVIAGILEVTSEVFVKIEYTMNDEDTGGADVDNNELLLQLLITFG